MYTHPYLCANCSTVITVEQPRPIASNAFYLYRCPHCRQQEIIATYSAVTPSPAPLLPGRKARATSSRPVPLAWELRRMDRRATAL
jgi:hypothetical protein